MGNDESDLVKKVFAGSLACSSAVEIINSWRDPGKELSAYLLIAKYARDNGDISSAQVADAMIKTTNLRLKYRE